jgi:acetylornithine deacetylase
LDLCRSLRGFGVVSVSLPGKAAHSSQAELGVNALTHLGRLLHAIDEHAPGLRETGGDLMATVARGGSSPFVIPDSAECIVEVRTSPDGKGAAALGVVTSLLAPEWSASTDLIAARDGWRLDDTGPAADLAARLGEALGTEPTFDAPYWMEAPLWQAVCPTLICGPGGGGLHAIDEWVDLDQVLSFTTALITVLTHLNTA